jgi:hypothetical protein
MRIRKLAALGTTMIVLTVGVAPLLSNAADHLDAPALGGTVVDGMFAPHSEHGDRDINDLYVFKAPDAANRTVLAMTTNPAVNLFGGHFGTNVRYVFNVDTNGDNVQDAAYVATFGKADKKGNQHYDIKLYTGSHALDLKGQGMLIGAGNTNGPTGGPGPGGSRVRTWAGLRSDPFFFDLTGFIGTTTLLETGTAVGDDRLGDGEATDFFLHLNTEAIVLSIPNHDLPNAIGVWATTSWQDGAVWRPADQMGRPAINTVFNPPADKNDFNVTPPSQQATAFGGKFRTNVVNGLIFFSSLDTASGGSYSTAQAGALADILIPDVLTYSRTSTLPAPLNGRGLRDDVIDTELNITTGGDPLGLFGRDATGAVPGDGVGPHNDYLAGFPYLGKPH